MGAIAETVLIFMLLYAAVIALYPIVFARQRVIDERMHELAMDVRAAGRVEDSEEARIGLARQVVRTVATRLPKPVMSPHHTARLKRDLLLAGFSGADAQRIFHLARLGLFAVGAVLGILAGCAAEASVANVIICATAGAIFGVMAPAMYIGHRGRVRQRTISNELADVVDLLVVSIEAGLGINEALRMVGAECDRQHEEIGRELSIVSGEMAAGATLGDAMANLSGRTAVEEIRPLAAALVQSEHLGAKIGQALRASSDALRAQRRLRAEEAAQKASVKIMFPLVLLILPAMMMLVVGPAVIQVLRTLRGA